MKSSKPTSISRFFITVLRLGIGWHFLYEGFSKLQVENWTAQSFLEGATGPLAPAYQWLASQAEVMQVVDLMNIYGLLLIGAALFLGVFVRFAAFCGAMLLALYYFAYPPFGASLLYQSDGGNLFIVNKQFIEGVALLAFVFLKEGGFGIDNLFVFFRARKKARKVSSESEVAAAVPLLAASPRREAIKNLATIPALGILGAGALYSREKFQVDAMSGGTIQLQKTALSELKGELPQVKVGKENMSRLVLGGNLIGGWAHSRDLIYVSSLFKAYNTEKKIFETLQLAEAAGINTINIGNPTNPVMAKYKKLFGSKIQVISQVHPGKDPKETIFDQINFSIDNGADVIQIQGNATDALVRDGQMDVIAKMMDYIKEQGYTCGLGAHSVFALIETEKAGLTPDYYMKTMHHDRYWSAHPKENRKEYEVMGGSSNEHEKFHDNIWCTHPEETTEFVSRVKVPVMGFKVLAAGAIRPQDGFRWAFEKGADLICVGMFDFQVVENVNTTLDLLKNLKRERPWLASA